MAAANGSEADVPTEVQDAAYGCDECNEGYYGIDCSVALYQEQDSSSGSVSLVTGSLVSTFDGASLELFSVGAVNLMRSDPSSGDATDVQAVFEPCAGRFSS